MFLAPRVSNFISRRVPEKDEEGITEELNYGTSFEINLAFAFDEFHINLSNF